MPLPPGPQHTALRQTWRWVKDPIGYLDEMAARYGYGTPFTMRRVGGMRLVIVSDPAHVKQVFLDTETYLAGKSQEAVKTFVGPHTLFALDGQAHKRHRRKLRPPFVGGRMGARGELMRGKQVVRVPENGPPESFRVTKLFGTQGIERVELESARAGDIVILAGVDSIEIGDTVCDPREPESLPRIAIDPPTIKVNFLVNTSPFAGREGRYVTSRQLGDRLRREVLTNVSIRLESLDKSDTFVVAARGELQIAVLVETMRREGFEFAVSRPEIILREIDGKRCEPVEDVAIDVPERAAGSVMEKLSARRGRMLSMQQAGARIQLQFAVPSRGLFGYRSEFLTDTRGEGILYRSVRGYERWAGELERRNVGGVVATETSQTTPHAIAKIQERATLFVPPGVAVYEGQVVGESRRPGDLNVNVCRAKKLDNMRAAGKDDNPIITPHRRLTIESALEWIEEDELLEVTPGNLRLRKRALSGSLRKRDANRSRG